ncbi:hypothetical protein NQ315_005803 [Exocentrus adspersus]|uniref:CCHC-type domain-containing protein n=1 Tax=Exocentrus adspersus TaxID=1586481 RepID=A0AAV8VR63_9CUCU|nr:hypothetical protein NQ315_005803 [Exocentrus adspersus]
MKLENKLKEFEEAVEKEMIKQSRLQSCNKCTRKEIWRCTSIYQAQLKNSKQRFEETLQQYEAEVSRMVNLAYPTEVIEQLSNQDVKMKKTHTYLDDWMYQILEKYKNRRHSKNSTFNKTRGIRCWTCGAEGHLRSRCPQSNSDGENTGGSYITRVQGRRPMVCYQVPPPQKIPLQCNGASLAAPGRVCGRECKMIVDTGSSHTIVRPNIVAHCKMQDREEKYLLETARAKSIPVKGVHLAEIKIGNKTFKQKVFVADITDDVLLGLDVMSKDFLLGLPRGVMKINNEEAHLKV